MEDEDFDGWRGTALRVTLGTRFGAILHAVWEQDMPPAGPEFLGKATVTSDGFVLCDYRDRQGRRHRGALVGSYNDLMGNVRGIAKHMRLTNEQRDLLEVEVDKWITTDYRRETA